MTDNWMPNKRKHQSKRTVFDMQAEIRRLQAEIEQLQEENQRFALIVGRELRAEIEQLRQDNTELLANDGRLRLLLARHQLARNDKTLTVDTSHALENKP